MCFAEAKTETDPKSFQDRTTFLLGCASILDILKWTPTAFIEHDAGIPSLSSTHSLCS